MAHLLGGEVGKGVKGEYGLATLELDDASDALFGGLGGTQQVWMSHRDVVGRVPEGFSIAGRTGTCTVAAMAAPARGFYAVQFHLEVVHTTPGKEYLANFAFNVCGCRQDWDVRHRAPLLDDEIRDCVAGRSALFFVSGGADARAPLSATTEGVGAGPR